jgi:uncharacterized cupin superfamily protein
MTDGPKNIVRAAGLQRESAAHIKHSMNPNSEVFVHRLSDHAGIERLHMNIARIPAGKEGYLPHAQTIQEEWLFIVEGSGMVQIGEDDVSIGPGDYVGFPVDGTAHHLRNTGAQDLVVLQGGERTPREVARFPTIAKTALLDCPNVTFYGDDGSVEKRHLSQWMAKE